MNPRSIPKASFRILTMGARQFAVADPMDRTRCSAFSSWSLTPMTTMQSMVSFGGTVRMTLLAPASRCFSSHARVRYMVVDSMTISTSAAT